MEAGGTNREESVANIVESIATLGREMIASGSAPFAAAEVRLNRRQLDALFLIAHHPQPVSPGVLADLLGVTAGAVTQLVDGLREAGLVEQTVHPHDARSRILGLTDSARATVDAFEGQVVDRMAPRFAGLTDRELQRLAELLAKTRGGT